MEKAQFRYGLAVAVVIAAALAASGAFAQLTPNQTPAFAKGKPYTFTYTENFDCIDEPTDDLNFNGILAQSDPGEMQVPICQPGVEPTVTPTGAKIKSIDKLYVIVPMFSVTTDTNIDDAIPCPATLPFAGEVCGPALGTFLTTGAGSVINNGSIPEAFRIPSALSPGITTQCPTATDPPGSCTMHGDVTDLGTALVALGVLPAPAANVYVPLVNHSHVIDTSLNSKKSIWWQIIIDVVNDPAVWPDAGGTTGITSLKALRTAQSTPSTVSGSKVNQVDADVPSNFFLFFGSQKNKTVTGSSMPGMPGM